jgi:hypothetical protein
MMSNEDKLYTKFVALDESYNFIVHNIFIWSAFDAKIFNSQYFIELIPK